MRRNKGWFAGINLVRSWERVGRVFAGSGAESVNVMAHVLAKVLGGG